VVVGPDADHVETRTPAAEIGVVVVDVGPEDPFVSPDVEIGVVGNILFD
jgi:hypothetical protein